MATHRMHPHKRRFSGHRAVRFAALATVAAFAMPATASFAAVHYRLERVASNLAQPTFLAQAPGDPSNIVYYSTRIAAATGTGGGFGTVNNMGAIWRYDLNTGSATQVMNLNSRQLTGDEGLVGFAFSPDFNISGAPGFHKMYVSSSQFVASNSAPIERVEEYNVGAGGTATFSKTVLQYNNINTQQNHTVDWIGFDPTTYSHAVGTADRNYLYIATGDGDLGGSAQTRPEQKASSVLGKVLRVDVDGSHPDAYGSDANKNFAIPPTNPIPLWNSSHPANQQLVGTHQTYTAGSPLVADYGPALGEIYVTGTRNTFRMSIDRTTGDYWMGDVGENTREEVNFLKSGTYNGSTPPVDFGYASREGTVPTRSTAGAGFADAVANSTGTTSLQWNTGTITAQGTITINGSTAVNSTNPVREGDHNVSADHPNAGRSSYIGGYMYRGPIPELQGKYIYADFVNSNIFMVDSIDRNMSLSSYSGTNFNLDPTTQLATLGNRMTAYHAGTFSGSSSTTPLDGAWANLVIDPSNPALSLRIGRIVSFGEDESGNVYVIDFGGDFGSASFAQDYPNAGRGQIFRLTPAIINSNWNVNGVGTWSVDSNWIGGIPSGSPNGPGDQANFGTSFSPRTATVDGPKTIGGITFDSSQSYTIAGPGPLTFQGLNGAGATATVNSGTHTISAPLVLNSDLTIQVLAPSSQLLWTDPAPAMTGRTITKLGPGLTEFTNIRADGLVATDGTTRISLKPTANSAAGTSVLKSLSIGNAGGTGVVDLTNNSLVIDYTGVVGTLLSDTRTNLLTGNLFSSAAGSGKTLGYGDNALLGRSTFSGVNVDASSVLIKFTWGGDANLDGQVDVTDLGALATNWQTSGAWTGGDFNYDGFVDVTDLGVLATNWQAGVGSPLGKSLDEALASLGLAGVSVPEPTFIPAVIVLAGSAILRRRWKSM